MWNLPLERESARHITRITVQTMVAGAATYVAMDKLEFPRLSWAVISVLFTIHLSADSTLQAGLGRFSGVVLGVGLGLLSVELAGGEGAILWRLISTTAVTKAIATVWPILNYSTVVAAFIALYPDPEITGALELAAAILIGAGMGSASALLTWPEWGRQRTIRLICEALHDCRVLLEFSFEGMEKDYRRQRSLIHARFLSHLEAAREKASETYLWPRLKGGLALHEMLAATERLWLGLVVFDRAITDKQPSLGMEAIANLRPLREEAQETACLFLDSLVSFLQERGPAPSPSKVKEKITETRETAERMAIKTPDLHQHQARSLQALIFALEEVETNLIRLGTLMAARPTEKRRGLAEGH